MKIKGLILDVDGTIADTEELHRQAFNQSFEEFNLNWHWSTEDYRALLAISGGKERLKNYLNTDKELEEKISNPYLFISELHQRKSENYRSLLRDKDIQLRPGIIRLINEAKNAGIKIGVATNSSMANLTTLLNKKLELEEIFSVMATSDVVNDKKPSPVVYQHVLLALGLSTDVCIAIEDTSNGNQAALNCGLCTIITTHLYTINDNFTGASLVLNHLGEPNQPFTAAQGYTYGKNYVDVALLNNIITEKIDAESFSQNVASMR